MVGKCRLPWAATILPPMKSPYRGWILTWSIASGAGAYSKTCLASAADCFFVIAIRLIDREVVDGLVGAGAFLVDLHEHVVQERRRAKAQPVGRHPVGAERLVSDNQERDRLLGGADAPGGLEADRPPRLADEVADRFHHHECDARGGG